MVKHLMRSLFDFGWNGMIQGLYRCGLYRIHHLTGFLALLEDLDVLDRVREADRLLG